MVMTLLSCLIFSQVFGQTNAQNIEALMEKVEGKDGKDLIQWNGYDSEEKIPAELKAAFETYWNAFHDLDFMKCYNMIFEGYRQHVSSTAYISKKHMKLSGLIIHSVSVQSGSCAIVEVGMVASAEMFHFSDMKVKQKWIFNKDHWEVFLVPKMEYMGFKYQTKNVPVFTFPCDELMSPLQDTKPETKAEVQEKQP